MSGSSKMILTLSIIHQNQKVLLGMKKRGFGAGRWNGFGGKVLENETIEEGAKREFKEEAQVDVLDLEKLGVLDFEFKGNPELLEVHIFKSKSFLGEPKETEEMKPQWFDINDIPFDKMWPDDKYWIPLFIKGKKFKGRFLFGENDLILEKNLIEVENL